MVLLEVCANSITSAIAAQNGGAFRVELCENLKEGGTTPSYGQILMARKLLHIKLYVLIRPRAGDFLYTEQEFDVMTADVQYCIEAGCDGIVIGMLNADGSIDKGRCKLLAKMAKQAGVGVTFHRAFDVCAEQFKALEDIIEIGCERILTSGAKSTAIEGMDTIASLIEKAGDRIIIMPGSGINETNVADLIHNTGAKEIHASAKVVAKSRMVFKNEYIVTGENTHEVTDTEKVRQIIKAANG